MAVVAFWWFGFGYSIIQKKCSQLIKEKSRNTWMVVGGNTKKKVEQITTVAGNKMILEKFMFCFVQINVEQIVHVCF